MPENANYEYNNFLCVVDPVSGRIDETITFDPAPDAHPQHPTIYPYDLQFTNDGFGIVLLRARAASNLEWRYIDGANNNQLSLSGYRWYEKIFEELYRSYDGNKLWANKAPADYTTVYSVSRNEPIPKEYAIHGKFQSDEFYAGGRLVDMQFSPFGNKVFISAAPRSVCVVDLDTDTYSVVIMGDARDPVRELAAVSVLSLLQLNDNLDERVLEDVISQLLVMNHEHNVVVELLLITR